MTVRGLTVRELTGGAECRRVLGIAAADQHSLTSCGPHGRSHPMIKSLVDSAAVVTDVKAQGKEAAIKELLTAAQDAGVLAKKAALVLGKKLLEREAIGSTGFGNGVAVPHGKHEGVERPLLVLARHRAGLDWRAIDGRPVHIVFFLLSPADEPETHLQCLRWISTLARNADFRRFLLDAKDAATMRDLLREMLPPA